MIFYSVRWLLHAYLFFTLCSTLVVPVGLFFAVVFSTCLLPSAYFLTSLSTVLCGVDFVVFFVWFFLLFVFDLFLLFFVLLLFAAVVLLALPCAAAASVAAAVPAFTDWCWD